MSKLNIHRNIFLEREELLRFQKFMIESNVRDAFLSNTLTWGILQTGAEPYPDFQVGVGTSAGTVKIAADSKALTDDGLMITQPAIDNISVPSDGNWYWMKIAHEYSNVEEGECSITADGEVSGVNTVFSEVLRGQGTEVPVKIKFINSTGNTGVYEVVVRNSDTSIVLAGDGFTAESGLKYFVIGSTPLGDTVTSSQEEGLYFYDGCDISFVVESVSDTAPGGKVDDKEFWIARVRNVSGTVTVEDKRTEYWTYLIAGLDNKLDKDNNLSDLTDVVEARSNLGVASISEIESAYFGDSGWLDMNSGVATSPTGFNIKARRFGQHTTISGKFKFDGNSSPGAILASIPYSSIGLDARPLVNIYFEVNEVGSGTKNRGMRAYVEAYTAGDSNLQIKILDAFKEDIDPEDLSFTITYVNR